MEAHHSISVLMIVDDFPPLMCGVGNYTASLAQALVRSGVAITILTKQVAGAGREQEIDGVRISRAVRGWFISDIRVVLDHLDELGPEAVLHIQYSSASGYYRRSMINLLPAVTRLVRPRTQVIVTLHGFHEQRLRWRARAAPMLFASHARIFVHHKDQAMARRLLKWSKVQSVLIPQAAGIPAMQFTAEERTATRLSLGFERCDRVIVFFGSLRPDKGFEAIIRAVRAVRARQVAVALLVLTDLEAPVRNDATARAQLAQARDEGWATVVNAPTSDAVPLLLSTADLAVFPFTMGASENRSSLLAALVNGVPVLTTRGPSTPERFEQEYGVETVPAGDQAALTCGIESLLSQPAALRALQDRAVVAGRALSWETIASKTVSLYRSMLDRSKSAPRQRSPHAQDRTARTDAARIE